ncbi:bifunctional 2-C-methyl-D-erythritol 4-phosphate cytidylyltransferase/2-C-methyl-D-erythritol 2,4-cyclodiphosphate synthase [Rhodobacteraceae bacterium CCMM004]|nr:bifunctional 2-C-methyl-D-erythritol 4-phosphate cytidylyltransferase/2-C-methyl-D-erythritol 2,4-cyclodiphosphate synthase [Rhodobacteraceae bacterium CCMM004]
MSSTAAVIVAAGRGRRVGGPLPKQFRTLAGRTVLAWTLEAFRTAPQVGRIVLVLNPDDMGLAAGYAAHPDVAVAAGGATRADSVRAGLEALADDPPDRVLIHDVARPLVDHALIGRVVAALDDHPAAAPAVPVVDALWSGGDGVVTGLRDRTGLYRAQTPQGFRYAAIAAAHARHGGDAADDVAVAVAEGLDVAIVEGDERNLKITTEADFARAEVLMEKDVDIRTGNGFDVHAFAPGDAVTLCGIAVPHDRALKGHSDADVGLHAVTDAIYGALAEGDIGRHFPPSDPQWRGAPSDIFLDHAVARATERGYRISNIDLTLICERPKIGPRAPEMTDRLAEIAGIGPDRVSVKATTSERLGFTGREEGIAALATVTLVSP